MLDVSSVVESACRRSASMHVYAQCVGQRPGPRLPRARSPSHRPPGVLAAILVLITGETCMADQGIYRLLGPASASDGGLIPILRERRTRRAFAPHALSLVEVAQLLWAAQAITSPEGPAHGTLCRRALSAGAVPSGRQRGGAAARTLSLCAGPARTEGRPSRGPSARHRGSGTETGLGRRGPRRRGRDRDRFKRNPLSPDGHRLTSNRCRIPPIGISTRGIGFPSSSRISWRVLRSMKSRSRASTSFVESG